MARHKLEFFIDRISKDFNISVRDKLIMNLIIRLGLSTTEIVEIKMSHLNFSTDLFKLIVPNPKKDNATQIIVTRSKESSHLFDLLIEYLLERKKIIAKQDYLFLSQRLSPLDRNVINKSFKRHAPTLVKKGYNTETIRKSPLNILADPNTKVQIISKEDLKKIEAKPSVPSALEKIHVTKDFKKLYLIDRDKELEQIKSILSASSPSINIICGPLGIGKTSLVSFTENYAAKRQIKFIKKTFYKGHKNFGIFHEISGNVSLKHAHPQILFEQLMRAILDKSLDNPLVLVFEDIHHADPDCLDFLRYLAKSINLRAKKESNEKILSPSPLPLSPKGEGKRREPRDKPLGIPKSKIIIFLTCDDKEKASLLEIDNYNLIDLSPISYNGISQFSHQFFRNAHLSKKLMDNIWGLSSGNPQYIKEILNHLHKNKKSLLKIRKNTVFCSSWSIPVKINALEHKKVLYLDKFSKKLLLIIALLGRAFNQDLILNIANKVSRHKADYSQIINRLKRRGYLSEIAPGFVYLYHETMRQPILEISDKNDIDKIKKHIIKALEQDDNFVTDIAYQLDEPEAHINAAQYLRRIGSKKAALNYFELAAANSNINKNQKAAILKSMQNIYLELKQFDKAIECAKKNKDFESLMSLGEIYLKKGDYDNSLVSLDKAKDTDKITNKNLANIYLKIAKTLNKKTDYMVAVKICSKALKLLEKEKSYPPHPYPSPQGEREKEPREILCAEANILNEMGLSYIYLKQFDKADDALTKSQILAKRINDKEIQINASLLAGMLCYFKGDLKSAISIYNETRNLAHASYNKLLEGIAIMNIGVSLHAQGDLVKTIENYTQAKDIFDLTEEDHQKANMLVNLNIIHTSCGNFTLAYDYAKEALAISQKNNLKIFIASMEHMIGVIKKNLGDYISAEEYLDKALHHIEELADMNKACLVLFSQAEIYLELNKFKEASDKTKIALNLGLKNNLKNIQYYGFLMQAQIEIESGKQDPDTIFSFLEKAKATRENKRYEPLPDYKLKEDWLFATYSKIAGKDKDAEKIVRTLNNSVTDYAKNLSPDLGKMYIKSREKYLNIPEIASLESKEDVISRLTTEKSFYKESLEIVESIALRGDNVSDLEKTLRNIISIKNAKKALALFVDNKNISKSICITKEGKKASDITVPSQLVNYVLDNNLPLSSTESSTLLTEKKWQCLPLRNINDSLGVLFLSFEKDISKIPEQKEKEFKNLLTICILTMNKIMQTEKISSLTLEKTNLLNKLKSLKDVSFEKEMGFIPLKKFRKKSDYKYNYSEIIGESPNLCKILELLDRVIDSDISILITGESGTGKELIARAVHFNNQERKNNPFLSINCASLPETLLESELFGHKKGSFTGALSDKIGLFEAANNGTIFLDEIGDMPIALQTKLLRVLQNGEIRRVGDNVIRKTNVRVISATNKDLSLLTKENKFRKDLFYRLNAFSLTMPPLRKRIKDIPLLVDFLVKKHGLGKKYKIDKKLILAFKKYDWPGNIRELENEIVKLIALSTGSFIGVDLVKDDARF